MSKTEGLLILDTQNVAAGGDKAEKAAGPCTQSVARRKLVDISNLPHKPRPFIQDNKSQSIPTCTKAYIEQLQKENVALVKMLAQRNKIVEQSGIELERLRLNLIKVQEQNRQLALSHSQMLMELNSGKDRLKALQHELGCKTGLLKARELEGGEACEVPCQNADAEVNLIKLPEEGETSTVNGDDEKPRTTKRRLRSQSFGFSEPLQSEEKDGNRRPSMRRQSARFKPVESKSAEDLSDKDGTEYLECPLPDDPVLENGSTPGSASVKNEDNRSNYEMNLVKLSEEGETSTVGRDDEKPRNGKRRLQSQSFGCSEPLQSEENAGNRRPFTRTKSARFTKPVESESAEYPSEKDDTKFPEQVLENRSTSGSASVEIEDNNRSTSGFKYESQEIGRSSPCRPSRLAAKKVQSYKEIPLNVKMRRSE